MYGILRSMLKVVIRNHILDYVVIHMSPLWLSGWCMVQCGGTKTPQDFICSQNIIRDNRMLTYYPLLFLGTYNILQRFCSSVLFQAPTRQSWRRHVDCSLIKNLISYDDFEHASQSSIQKLPRYNSCIRCLRC
jgi:hypothetical protein